MDPTKHFDQAVFDRLLKGIQSLGSQRNMLLVVAQEAHLRRAIMDLVAGQIIDTAQGLDLMMNVSTAWQQALRRAESVAITVEDEQQIAFLHAQEYMHLITSAPSQAASGQILGIAQGYFETLKDFRLINLQTHQTLNQQALDLVDDWKTVHRASAGLE